MTQPGSEDGNAEGVEIKDYAPIKPVLLQGNPGQDKETIRG